MRDFLLWKQTTNDQDAADFFSDQRDVFIDKSIRADIGEYNNETIKAVYANS